MASKRKRMGRPSKPPVPGERVSLGLRVTANMKMKLDQAAAESGRSQSQEAELRLEQSFMRGEELVIAQGSAFSPVFFIKGEMWVYVGEESVAPLRMSSKDQERLLRFLRHMRGEYTDEEIEEAGERHMLMLGDVKKGK